MIKVQTIENKIQYIQLNLNFPKLFKVFRQKTIFYFFKQFNIKLLIIFSAKVNLIGKSYHTSAVYRNKSSTHNTSI